MSVPKEWRDPIVLLHEDTIAPSMRVVRQRAQPWVARIEYCRGSLEGGDWVSAHDYARKQRYCFNGLADVLNHEFRTGGLRALHLLYAMVLEAGTRHAFPHNAACDDLADTLELLASTARRMAVQFPELLERSQDLRIGLEEDS